MKKDHGIRRFDIVFRDGSRRTYNDRAKLHSFDNQSAEEYYDECTGEYIEKWMNNGRLTAVRRTDEKTYNNDFFNPKNVSIEIRDGQGNYHSFNGFSAFVDPEVLMWFKHGKSHREDGPAVIYKTGEKEYWLNGVDVTKSKIR